MKPSLKLLLSLLTLGVATVPFVRASDDPPTVQVPVPAAPDSSDATTPAAKGKGNRLMRGGAGMEELKAMKEKLNLTADQETKIKDIWKSHAADLKAARGDRAKMAEVLKTQHSEVRAVLTPDQQKTFDTMTPAGRGKGKGKKKDDV
jgi:Spy/CpxP family protein refolding chaperone